MRLITVSFLVILLSTASSGQTAFGDLLSDYNNDPQVITTAVPFLVITPDSRAGAMGESGVATTPDVYSLHWNVSKLAFLEDNSGFSISYTPWLGKLVPDISLAYLTGYSKINDNSAWSAALRYFSLGNITFTDENATELGTYDPNEYAFDLGYGMKFNDNLSGGIAMRYIYSNLTGGQNIAGYSTEAGRSFAVDLSTYYQSELNDNGEWAVGLNLSNIGTKISYTGSDEKDFIPMNLRVGGRYSMDIDDYNNFSVSFDINKLLVPTTPLYAVNEDGQPIDINGNIVQEGSPEHHIAAGKDPNVSVVSAIFQSFGDAPGGISEEWRELMYSLGFEYWYNNQFAFRGGYFHEHERKGNRKYFTLGAGLKMNVFALDFAYLITASQEVQSPLESTMRFSLVFDIGAFRGGSNEEL